MGPRSLAEHRLVGLDTMVFVYALEDHPELGDPCRRLLAAIQEGRSRAVASALVLGELLVRPYRENRPDIARRYSDLLVGYRNLELVTADRAICETAAQLRGREPSLRLPDAVHVATAISKGATALVTGDRRMRDVAGLEILRPV